MFALSDQSDFLYPSFGSLQLFHCFNRPLGCFHFTTAFYFVLVYHITSQLIALKFVIITRDKIVFINPSSLHIKNFFKQLFFPPQMTMVRPAWSSASYLTTTVAPTSSRRWWAHWRRPRRGRWSTSRASCSCRASTTTWTSCCCRSETKSWITTL